MNVVTSPYCAKAYMRFHKLQAGFHSETCAKQSHKLQWIFPDPGIEYPWLFKEKSPGLGLKPSIPPRHGS